MRGGTQLEHHPHARFQLEPAPRKVASITPLRANTASSAHEADSLNEAADAVTGEEHSRCLPRAAGSDGHARDRGPNAADSESGRAASRYVPRSVVREVYARDGGQCTFVSPEGRRCHERGFLELHHHGILYARGGPATADNLRVACRSHNALYAERDLGRAFMHSKLVQVRSPKSHAPNELVLRREQT